MHKIVKMLCKDCALQRTGEMTVNPAKLTKKAVKPKNKEEKTVKTKKKKTVKPKNSSRKPQKHPV